MTKSIDNKILEAYKEVQRYEFGGVTSRLVAQKDMDNAKGAVKRLAAESRDSKFSDPAFDYLASSDAGVRYAASAYGKRHMDALGQMTIGALYSLRYEPVLKQYLKSDEIAKVKEVLDQFSKETYGHVVEEVAKAHEKVESRTENFSDEQKRDAKKVLKKYAEVYEALNLLESANFENLRPKAVGENYKMKFQDYVKSLTAEEE